MFRRGEMFYMQDSATGRQTSLRTKDETEAISLLEARNAAQRQPVLNLHLARAYLTASDPLSLSAHGRWSWIRCRAEARRAGCTFFVIGQKRNVAAQKSLVAEVEQLKKVVNPCPTGLPPALPPIRQISLTEEIASSHLRLPLKNANGVEQTHEAKLQTLQDWFDKKLISQAELDSNRQQILSEL